VDRGRARELVGFACTRGHQPACVELAVDLVNDPTDPRDRARAGELLEAACKKSDPDGCEMLATFRLSEPGAVGAREAAQRSCELGDPGGCAVYGHTLRDAIGGPADPSGARTAFETACRGKDWRGCQELGQ
jgi:TPR repeat protein